MPTFKDKLDREWAVEITRDLIPGLRAAGLDLGTLPKHPEQLAVLDDVDGFGRVVWVLCGKQAAALGLGELAFAEGFNGAVAGAACDAITEAITDFFHGRRPAAARAAREQLPRMRTAADLATERMMKAAADQVIADLEATTPSGSTNSATNSAGSAGSTPGRSPSGA